MSTTRCEFLVTETDEKALGQIYNLGGPPADFVTFAQLLIEVNGSGVFSVRKFPKERKKIDIGDYYADDRLIRRELGWKPRVDLKSALKRTLGYYRSEIAHYL